MYTVHGSLPSGSRECEARCVSSEDTVCLEKQIPVHVCFLLLFYLFIYLFWLCWVFVSVRGLSLVAASGGHSSSRCMGLSLSRPLLLWSAGSVVVAHGPSCSVACGIFPDRGSNPCPLHWQADSQPLRHQGSPTFFFLTEMTLYYNHPSFFIFCILLHCMDVPKFPSQVLIF